MNKGLQKHTANFTPLWLAYLRLGFVDSARIIVYGHSLGTFVAVQLANTHYVVGAVF
jgi:pimeloyl-ACP methyl ester carboxylesterase